MNQIVFQEVFWLFLIVFLIARIEEIVVFGDIMYFNNTPDA